MSTIPANNTPPPTSPIDLAPRASAASVFDAATGPSFSDHLQEAYRPPVTSDHHDSSHDDSTAEHSKVEQPQAAASKEQASKPEATDEAAHESEPPQAEATNTEATQETTTSAEDPDAKAEENPTPVAEQKDQKQTTTEPGEAETVVVAATTEEKPAQPAETKVEQKQTQTTATEKVTEASKQALPNAGTQTGEDEAEPNTKQPVAEKSEIKADGEKQSKADQVVAKLAEKPDKDATKPGKAAKPEQPTAKQPAAEVVDQKTLPTESAEQQAEATTEETTSEKKPTTTATTKEQGTEATQVKQQSSPQPQSTNPVAGQTAVAEEDKSTKQTEAEATDTDESKDDRKEVEAKKSNPLLSKPSQKVSAEVALQPAGDAASQPTANTAAAQATEAPIDAVEATTEDKADQSTKRVEVVGDDKSSAKPAPRTSEITTDSAPRNTADSVETKQAARTDSGKQHVEVDRARFVQRVARAFNTVGENGGTLRLRLSPPELGSLRIEIEVRGSTMTARIEAETSAARTVLLDSLPALRDRLADQNIKVDRFDVELANQSTDDGSRQPTGQRDRQGEKSQYGNSPGGNARQAETASSENSSAKPVHDDTQLNVVV